MSLFSWWFLAVTALNSGFSNWAVIQPELLFMFRNWKWSIQIYSCTIYSHPSLTNFISTILQKSPPPVHGHSPLRTMEVWVSACICTESCFCESSARTQPSPLPPSLPPSLPVHQAKKLGTTAVLYLYHAYIQKHTHTLITLLLLGVNNMLSAEENKR